MVYARGKRQTNIREVRMNKQSDSTVEDCGNIFKIENSQSLEYHFEDLPPKHAADKSKIFYLIAFKLRGKLEKDGSNIKSKPVKKILVKRPAPPSNLEISETNPDMLQVIKARFHFIFI